MKSTFKNLVIGVLLLYLVYVLLPYSWEYLYDDATINLLLWDGFGAYVPIYGIVPWLFVAAYLFIAIGLLRFNKYARIALAVFVVGTGLISPIWGVVVTTGLDAVFSYFIVLGNGIILALAYFTDISNKFDA